MESERMSVEWSPGERATPWIVLDLPRAAWLVERRSAELTSILDTWLAAHAEGIACVIGDPAFRETPRVRSLTPELSKGLEFDLVVLIDPEKFGEGIEGAVDRYVAMTRATQQLVVLTS
jgi:superfamily I DNA/RNA helicase